jgi:two-component sensor histidine kinase
MENSDLTLATPPEASLRPPKLKGGPTERDSFLGDVGATSDFRKLFEHQKRIFDLVMNASQMGTWRYTIADNICVYDENAQRLYGLTEARFLHDEEGVKSKFHADDMDLMWSRVSKALDPAGDGRYDVEYRVKQLDGSWRWLSAWGLVEFEGDGPDRKAVAIVGASRDLTDRKQAEQLQRLLLDELGHRIKNMLARVQAVADQTLKGAPDLPSAREALNRRICSMAGAHDLLTSRNWSGADLSEVVARALDGFNSTRFGVSGSRVELSERQTLAFSMALHELVTNATKYGALSNSAGTVTICWKVEGESLRFRWTESGGPPVSAPGTLGFGSRLLERVVVSDLRGDVEFDYNPAGLRCSINAPMASNNGSRDEAEIGQSPI